MTSLKRSQNDADLEPPLDITRPFMDDEPGLRTAARALTDATGELHASRSYRYPYALVSWHADPVGIDIERVEPCDPAFAASICTPAETDEWSSLSNPHEYFIALWSSKEALAKALGNALDYDPRRLQAPMLWPDGRAGVWRAADLHITADHIAWVCWRSPHQITSARAGGSSPSTGT